MTLLLGWLPAVVPAAPFDCESQRCGLPGEAPYGNLVIAEVEQVATDEAAAALFRGARAHGYWQALPDDPVAFAKAIRPLSVAIPGRGESASLTLLMSRALTGGIEFQPGDLIRYQPRAAREERSGSRDGDPVEAVYGEIHGCVAVLCRAEDMACPARYRPGIYRPGTGEPLDPAAGTPLPAGPRIDPFTYFPLRPGIVLPP